MRIVGLWFQVQFLIDNERPWMFLESEIFNKFVTVQSLIVNRLHSGREELDSEHLAAKYFHSELEPETL